MGDDKDLSRFICPLTGNIMSDPVIAADGHTYERIAIKKWFCNHSISPWTRRPLHSKELTSNLSIRSAIKRWEACVTPPLTTVDCNAPTFKELENELDKLAIGDQPQPVQSVQDLSELTSQERNRMCDGNCEIFQPQGGFSRSPEDLVRYTNYRRLCYACQKLVWEDFFDDSL